MIKAVTAGLLFSSAGWGAAQALPILETFSYADGITTVTSGGNWVAHSGASSPYQTTSSVSDSGGSLSYLNFPASTGGRVVGSWGGGSREDINRQFTTVTEGLTAYVSALVKVTTVTGTGDYFLHFKDNTAGGFRGRVFARPGGTAGTVNFGLSFGSGTASGYAPIDIPAGQTVLLVLGLDLVSGAANDVSNLWINPALGQSTPPAPTLTASTGAADLPVSSLALRLGGTGTGTVELDEIRINTSWTGVTPASIPAGVTNWSFFE